MSGALDISAVRDVLIEAGEPDPGALSARPIPGGASRELWALTRSGSDSPSWVLRRDPPGEYPQTSRACEYAVHLAAHDAGVPVPRPVALELDGGRFETAGMLMSWVAGEAIPRRVLRNPALADARDALPSQLGAVLALLRQVDTGPLVGYASMPQDAAASAIALVRQQLDNTGEALPALELGLRWLESYRPPPAPPAVVHGDFRLGNLIIGPEGLQAVIDWEFWHFGDPVEDIAWVCARPWRFGGAGGEVAGVGNLSDLLAALGEAINPASLRWWHVMVQAKWGAYCAEQALIARDGGQVSLERTVLGRRVAEAEWDLLELIEEA